MMKTLLTCVLRGLSTAIVGLLFWAGQSVCCPRRSVLTQRAPFCQLARRRRKTMGTDFTGGGRCGGCAHSQC